MLDFSTLVPGPLATLLLVDAGADVIKVERPGRGDEMRGYEPKAGPDGIGFALLNRGKRSITLDLKAPDAVDRLMPLLRTADVLVEQYRPGVMDRFGLGYQALSAINPGLIYCSITGYGQTGPKAAAAGHDLNFVADSGMLSLAAGADGAPVLPAVQVGDIGGGAYPAVVNILLALLQRNRTGRGCHLDIAMAENLFAFQYWALGIAVAGGQGPRPGGELLTGGSPRYQLYRTADGRFVAAAPLEDKFWENFCTIIGLPDDLRDDARDPAATIQAVAAAMASRDADHWRAAFAGKDVCCSIVSTMQEAMADDHVAARDLFARGLVVDGRTVPAVPTPIAAGLRGDKADVGYPALGEANGLLDQTNPEARG
ncbi:crotonobetainyl-CoA:carnitine CoA-transferase CaiB-like acyl-CoA transferase [Azospirillum rugosum]|uniref:Crotonobetainyl-CoA:carnitine CoA-transferase CaiB-like acyl-CoA transferase n=1 Tax=Azospirillum rugosum TaxID=416170 RepID=A0ABS4SUV3_9PROT|nr:crotonobetainyl-CoA:carnitine CoA-transferase CaiB-like acyl-CoA transferase [Azospirillum rugosum]MDQ0529157.1 crotonobetainyl-CoA:carnitine CoA-transferase CaiB-like acyl-CoA transferase [Azospirillum rugosum]